MVDQGALDKQTYTYTAHRVLTVPGSGAALRILSESTPAISISMRDTFAPEPPKGLISVPGTAPALNGTAGPRRTIDLTWEPNTEVDLAGYLVYRLDAAGDPAGPARDVRLTTAPIAGPAYRDTSVLAGHRYIYRVTAVDQHGNESGPSEPVEDTFDGR